MQASDDDMLGPVDNAGSDESRPETPSSIRTDTDAESEVKDDAECGTRAYLADVLEHTCRLVLARIEHDGARPSDWYDAESAGAVWTCPLLGCDHIVDPLSLDDEACHIVHSVFGERSTSVNRWTFERVLAAECEYDPRMNHCRLSMSPGEIKHRRMCIDMIAWCHFQSAHLRGYGVLVRDMGEVDAEAGIVRPYNQ